MQLHHNFTGLAIAARRILPRRRVKDKNDFIIFQGHDWDPIIKSNVKRKRMSSQGENHAHGFTLISY